MQTGRKDYYFNEYKRFPFEYLVIPLILFGAVFGIVKAYQAIQKSRTPETAATYIMEGIQKQDISILERWVRLTENESRSLQQNNTSQDVLKSSFSELEQVNFKIKAFKVEPAKINGENADVPISLQYTTKSRASLQKARFQLPLQWKDNQWWTTTDTIRALAPKRSTFQY